MSLNLNLNVGGMIVLILAALAVFVNQSVAAYNLMVWSSYGSCGVIEQVPPKAIKAKSTK